MDWPTLEIFFFLVTDFSLPPFALHMEIWIYILHTYVLYVCIEILYVFKSLHLHIYMHAPTHIFSYLHKT